MESIIIQQRRTKAEPAAAKCCCPAPRPAAASRRKRWRDGDVSRARLKLVFNADTFFRVCRGQCDAHCASADEI